MGEQAERQPVQRVPELPGGRPWVLICERGIGLTLRIRDDYELNQADRLGAGVQLQQQQDRCVTFCGVGFEDGCNDKCLASAIWRELALGGDEPTTRP